MECDHIFKIDAIDMLPAPNCNESSGKEMEAQSKSPNGKMPDLPMPPSDPEETMLPDVPLQATPPKSPSQMSELTCVQVPQSALHHEQIKHHVECPSSGSTRGSKIPIPPTG